MKLNNVEVSGVYPNSEELLEDISYIESIFFNNSTETPTTSNDLKDSHKESKKSKTSNKSKVSNKSNKSDLDDLDDLKNNPYSSATQIYLRDVGDRIKAKFVSSGNRYNEKAKRRSFVIYLKENDDSIVFLQGTKLQEEIDLVKPEPNQTIIIEKTSQFKRARDRSHAKAAVFKIIKQ